MYDGDLGRCVLAVCSDGFVTKKKIGFFFPGPVWKLPGNGCDGLSWAACPPVDQGFEILWLAQLESRGRGGRACYQKADGGCGGAQARPPEEITCEISVWLESTSVGGSGKAFSTALFS